MSDIVAVKLYNGCSVITLCMMPHKIYMSYNRVCDVRGTGIVWCHTYSECDIIHSTWHVIYSACDIQNKVHVMSRILRVVVIKCGYDVLYSAYDGIDMPPVMSYSWCDVFHRAGVMTYTVDVMADRMGFKSDIELVLSYTHYVCHHIEWIWWHKHSGCHDIQTMVWYHQGCMWHHTQFLLCSTCSGCDLIYT